MKVLVVEMDKKLAIQRVEDYRITPVLIKYKYGRRWFNSSRGVIPYIDSIIEVSRLWSLSGVSRIIVSTLDGEQRDNWGKAESRREDKDTYRTIKELVWEK